MRAIVFDGRGGVEVLQVAAVPRPRPAPEQLLVRVRAAALNRADLLQRAGTYSAPPGETEIPGVEIAGEVESWGERVTGFARGQQVFGLVGGGGYAEYCPIDAQMAIPVPPRWSFVEAVAVPEVFFTADTTLCELGELQAGETLLVHAAASGVGTACVQLARHVGARVLCTVGSAEKAERLRALGADLAILYKERDFVEEVRRATGGAGVDVVEDFVGGTYFARNLAVLKPGGRLVLVGVLDEVEEAPVNLLELIMRRLQIKGSSMRPRPLADKRAISRNFEQKWLPLLVDGRLQPVVDSTFPFAEVARAHERMEANLNFGKVVLTLE
jgi:putative PIG3 family NAD(P)H quinone oxidoreductase